VINCYAGKPERKRGFGKPRHLCGNIILKRNLQEIVLQNLQ
jgi:hypothetical protein